MNHPFQPRPNVAGGGADNAASPSVGFMASSTSKPSQPQVPVAASVASKPMTGTPATAKPMPAKAPTKAPEKKGWFARLFGKSDSDDVVVKSSNEDKPKVQEKAKEVAQPVVERKVVDKPVEKAVAKPLTQDPMQKRHDELLNSVNDICRSLENSRAQKVEVSVADLVSPFPVENLDALTRTQEAVSGVLEKVAGRLDSAGKRDDLVVDSLKRVDGSLLSLAQVSERSITSMDGVKGALGSVNGSMETMQIELKRAGKRYEELCEKVQNNEREHVENMQKLQKRSLIMNALLGIALVGCAIAVIVAAAS